MHKTEQAIHVQPAARLLLWLGLAPLALALLRLFPPLELGAQGAGPAAAAIAPGSAAVAGVVAGAATLVWLVRGLTSASGAQVHALLRAAAFGALTSGMTSIALIGADAPSTFPAPAGTLSVLIASLPLLAAGLVADRRLDGRAARTAALFALVVWIEAVPGIALVGADLLQSWRPFVAEAAAAVLLVAAGLALMRSGSDGLAGWLAGLGSAAVVLAASRPGTVDTVVGMAAITVAAAAGALYAARPRTLRPIAASVELPGGTRIEAGTTKDDEDSELRLAHELRGTIAELLAARETIELQRGEIERISSTDSVTGVASRGAILERLRNEAAEARRYAHPLAVALLDLDGLSHLNRGHGLLTGDAILRELALRLRLRIREADALGRVDGDTFLAILPHTDERGATVFADTLRQRLTARPVATDVGEVSVTVSIGVAFMRPGMELTADDLLSRAEEALASAKAAGGNRIAFDRLHGLARIEERQFSRGQTPPPSDEGQAS